MFPTSQIRERRECNNYSRYSGSTRYQDRAYRALIFEPLVAGMPDHSLPVTGIFSPSRANTLRRHQRPGTSEKGLTMSIHAKGAPLPEVPPTHEAAPFINRKPQTPRKWACLRNSRPTRIMAGSPCVLRTCAPCFTALQLDFPIPQNGERRGCTTTRGVLDQIYNQDLQPGSTTMRNVQDAPRTAQLTHTERENAIKGARRHLVGTPARHRKAIPWRPRRLIRSRRGVRS
jgi:hypothetical protein